MSTASVAFEAPLTPEPVLEAIRAFAPRPDDRGVARLDEPALPRVVTWVEPAQNLWLLSIKNFGLALATFGVYHFWGRAEMNRQMVNAIHVDGRPVDFTGTGREAFISFILGTIIAASIVTAFVVVFLLGPGGASNATVEGIRQFRWQRLIISLPLLFLLGSITYRKRHHFLRRSWIGGARFGLTGHAWSYAWTHFWSAFTVPLSAGWAGPWRASMLAARKIDEMKHDSGLSFAARPDLKDLYRTFAVVWFGGVLVYVTTLVLLARVIGPELMASIHGLTVKPLASAPVLWAGSKVIAFALLPVLLLMVLWRKAWIEHQVSSVLFEGGKLRLQMPLGGYLAVSVGGLLLTVFSLGCFKPVARANYMRFVVGHVQVDGRLKFRAALPID